MAMNELISSCFSADCCFCSEIISEKGGRFFEIFGSVKKSRVIFDTENFVVMPSLGPVSAGHILLLPKMHLNSFSQIDNAYHAELEFIFSRAKVLLSDNCGAYAIFEHGTPAGAISGACGIVHAHLHMIPVGNEHVLLPNDNGLNWVPLKSSNLIFGLSEINKYGGVKEGYLFFVDENGVAHFSISPEVPSQYLRKHVAKALGVESWDWRDQACNEMVLFPLSWESNPDKRLEHP